MRLTTGHRLFGSAWPSLTLEIAHNANYYFSLVGGLSFMQ